MKHYSIFLIALLALMLTLQSCFNELIGISGSGSIQSENRPVSGFDAVELNIAGDVEITKDSLFSVEVSDFENLLPHIKTTVHGSMLTIEHNPKNMNLRNSEAKIRISMPSVNYLIVNGSGKISVLTGFDELNNIKISGSGSINALDSFHTTSLSIIISGSGNINAEGTADQLSTNISGSGNINLFGLVAQEASCVISGSGNTFVNVVQNLNAIISGSGNIEYIGNPTLTVNISGSGSVRSH